MKTAKIKKTKVTNTNVKQIFPFVIVEHEKKFYITIGNNVMSQNTFDNIEKAEEYINSKPYELIINVCCLAMEMQKKGENK